MITPHWFNNCRTLDEARAEYRRLCFKYHPDFGGDTLVMQAINVAYDQVKQALSAPKATHDHAHRYWHRPQRARPTDGPPHTERRSEPKPQPVHSRDYFKQRWNAAPWQPVAHDHWTRHLWDHSITIFRHPDPKFAGAWFVVLDNVFSPYFYDSRAEAEHAAFDLLYEKIKYLDI